MYRNRIQISLSILIVVIAFGFCSCSTQTPKPPPDSPTSKQTPNPVVYFEIPVSNMERAMGFYTKVFGFHFERDSIDHNDMALFPFSDAGTGITGALAKGTVYKPSKEGTLIYFSTLEMEAVLDRVVRNGGKILYPITSNGDLGRVAEFEDSEGNRIALHQKP